MKAGETSSCGRGQMTRRRSGKDEGCNKEIKMDCTDEDKCLGKRHNMFALFTRKLGDIM